MNVSTSARRIAACSSRMSFEALPWPMAARSRADMTGLKFEA